jgi:hypothetical protein
MTALLQSTLFVIFHYKDSPTTGHLLHSGLRQKESLEENLKTLECCVPLQAMLIDILIQKTQFEMRRFVSTILENGRYSRR